ncbi:uncharacterized protein LOC130719367 [Lotus japonicus]|uniref:uncharacterized protein LOC130719367 n=1 Tax=Lotus japonicus TaxID=34305 RepID=UPI00258C74F9|nr:uncharacterized protein LOC130719367 [Lotus japonicus]
MKTIGFDGSFVVEAEGFSGGIWLLWSKQYGKVEVMSSHRQFIHARITTSANLPSLLVTFVYGSPNISVRDFLWRELRRLASTISEPWMVIWDFNAYLHASDKVGGGPPNAVAMRKFSDCITDCAISDLGFKGPPSLGRVGVSRKGLIGDSSQRPFRFLATLLTHNDFPRLVKDSWQGEGTWVTASETFRDEATSWNHHVFGEIGRRKRRLMRRPEGINNKLRMAQVPYLEKLQRRLWNEYQSVLIQEELLWRQKSRVNWLNHGDKNTRFFHTATMVRRKRNKIEALDNGDGTSITDPEELRFMVREFFKELYTSSGPGPLYHGRNAFPQLPREKILDIMMILKLRSLVWEP